MFKRFILDILTKAVKRSRVILINGARQTGKTTLMRLLQQNHSFTYITLDDELTFLAAKANPTNFIASYKKPLIIDEIQRVPELFLAIKMDVDVHQDPGRFVVTGSANPLLLPRLGDSLAGRMEVLNVMPLSQGELCGEKEQFIPAVFNEWQWSEPEHVIPQHDIYKKIIVGGYPAAVACANEEDRLVWMRNYLNLILQRDVRDLMSIEKIAELPRLLWLLANRSASLLNVSEVARDAKLEMKTMQRYITLLETIFLIHVYPAWSTNISQRFIKSPKLSMVDTGLLAYLLNVSHEKTHSTQMAMGKLVENFVVAELLKQASWSEPYVRVFHSRTIGGHEIDIVLEDPSGRVVCIEVKASSTVQLSDAKGLIYMRDKLGDQYIQGIVLYTGAHAIPLDDRIWCVPIQSLWGTAWHSV